MGLGRFGQVVVPAFIALLLGASWNIETIFLILGVVPPIAAVAALQAESRTKTESSVPTATSLPQ
jgi:hypothetical protein